VTTVEAAAWTAANKARLEAVITGVRTRLEEHVAGSQRSAIVAPSADRLLAERPAAIDHLAAVFGLSSFERDILILCAGVEFEAAFGELCARAQGDPARTHATFSLALAALPDAHWSALAPNAPLRHWRLVEPAPGPLATSELRIDERVLHYLVGVDAVDDRLAGYVEPPRPPPIQLDVVPSHEGLARRIVRAWTDRLGEGPPPLIELCGADPSSKRVVAEAAALHLGMRLATIRTESLPLDPRELEALIRLCEREAALTATVLILDGDGVEGQDAARQAALTQLVEGLASALILLVRDRRPTRNRPAMVIDVAKPTTSEQLAMWQALVGPDRLDGQGDRLASQFDLGIRGMREATAEAMVEVSSTADRNELAGALWDACRAQARPRMDDLAQRVDARARWTDLVLPEGNLLALWPGAERPVVVGRGYAYDHVNASRDGRFWVGDESGAARLVVGSLKTGRCALLCETGSSLSTPQYTHPHPYFSPDNKWVIYNSDRTGIPHVYAAQLPDGLLESLE